MLYFRISVFNNHHGLLITSKIVIIRAFPLFVCHISFIIADNRGCTVPSFRIHMQKSLANNIVSCTNCGIRFRVFHAQCGSKLLSVFPWRIIFKPEKKRQTW
jgi:hypothetical protein